MQKCTPYDVSDHHSMKLSSIRTYLIYSMKHCSDCVSFNEYVLLAAKYEPIYQESFELVSHERNCWLALINNNDYVPHWLCVR